MKKFIFLATNLSSICFAASPINGLYLSGFGGASYLSGNLDLTRYDNYYNQSQYKQGFDVGGALGYQTDAWRIEAEINFIQANLKQLYLNGNPISNITGDAQAWLGFLNANYDLPFLHSNLIQPFVLGGLGYGWLNNTYPSGQNLQTQIHNTSFAYQAGAGLLFNVTNKISLGINYHYLSTTHVNTLGSRFQANLFNGSFTYRFDNCELK